MIRQVMNSAARIFLLLSAILCLHTAGKGQGTVSLGFYNLENFYDTVPSPFYDDRDYTPQGRRGWDGERYGQKLDNVARVLDLMALDIVGVAEVENENALRDLVTRLETDYNYIHRNSRDSRGMDVALLFKGDKFVPLHTELVPSPSGREFLYVRGELAGSRVDIVVCHLPSKMNRYSSRSNAMKALYAFVRRLHEADGEAQPIVMGDFNALPGERVMREAMAPEYGADTLRRVLFSPFAPLAAKGHGSYNYRNRWQMIDNIFISPRLEDGGLRYLRCGVFIKDYLLERPGSPREGRPLRTFCGERYLGGYSDHLPVFLYLEILR